MATYHELKAKISKLEAQAKELLKKESAGVVVKIRGLMSQYGLTVQDLGLGITKMGKKMSAMKPPQPPKYRDPVSGKTWSGKGKAPGWIVEATQKGKREDFLIDKVAAKPQVKKAASTKKVTPKKAVVAKSVAKKSAPIKPAVKPVVKMAAVAKKGAAKVKPAPKAAVAAPAATLNAKV